MFKWENVLWHQNVTTHGNRKKKKKQKRISKSCCVCICVCMLHHLQCAIALNRYRFFRLVFTFSDVVKWNILNCEWVHRAEESERVSEKTEKDKLKWKEKKTYNEKDFLNYDKLREAKKISNKKQSKKIKRKQEKKTLQKDKENSICFVYTNRVITFRRKEKKKQQENTQRKGEWTRLCVRVSVLFSLNKNNNQSFSYPYFHSKYLEILYDILICF